MTYTQWENQLIEWSNNLAEHANGKYSLEEMLAASMEVSEEITSILIRDGQGNAVEATR